MKSISIQSRIKLDQGKGSFFYWLPYKYSSTFELTQISRNLGCVFVEGACYSSREGYPRLPISLWTAWTLINYVYNFPHILTSTKLCIIIMM